MGVRSEAFTNAPIETSTRMVDNMAARAEDLHRTRNTSADVAGGLQGAVQVFGPRPQVVDHAGRGVGERVGEGVGTYAHVLDGERRVLRKAVRDLIEPRRHHLLQAAGEVVEIRSIVRP